MAALVVVVVVAGVAVYVATAPAHRSTTSTVSTTSSTSSTASAPQLSLTAVPPTPLISPGEIQNYSTIDVATTETGLSGTENLTVTAPAGLTVDLNQTSFPLSSLPLVIPVTLKAASTISPGNYTVSIDAASSGGSSTSQTFRVDVVQMLVVMLWPAFIPANITVTRGTVVTWINLNSEIGCCDPGLHDISFSTGPSYTSPLISTFQTTTFTFGTDGVYDYYCTIHPVMRGQVTVTG